jgi:type I restriction enzyme M protein
MPEASLLHCPIRGDLRVQQRAADSLTFTEEKHRIDAIRYLVQRKYPSENFGIETTLFRLGNNGRNSFRTDFAIYDRPFDDVRGKSLEKKLEHIRVLAEIKRDNSSADVAKAMQVKAALQMVPDLGTLGVYWDDIEQRFFYRHVDGKRPTVQVFDAPISKIPDWGTEVGSTQLTFNDLDPAKDLVRIFDEIEDALHTYVTDKGERYRLIQQLLLTKIHDEALHRAASKAHIALAFQDFSVEAISDSEALRRLDAALLKAAAHYNQYLPHDKQIASRFDCPAEALRNCSKLLAPINLLKSKVQVIQAFYMKFAQSLYSWDLAQYFTPHEVIDFIVDIVNPRAGEHIHDPACGSADFLISAFRRAGPTSENCVWGSDNSKQAVQVSILNMVLNGDGKTQIINQDSLESYSSKSKKFAAVLCNPPFGTKILERRFQVLRKFDMGHKWAPEDSKQADLNLTDEVRSAQQTGILFAELCVRLTQPGGRIGIILPNGYLGNRSAEYVALREWLLRQTRLIGIVAFPRFTFKKSGADVSASVMFLEKRSEPLKRARESKGYRFYAGNIESVGWRAGDKTAVPLYRRDPENGTLLLSNDNEPILDADFAEVLDEFLRSPATSGADWIFEDRELPRGSQTWSINIKDVVSSAALNLDPKRHSYKFNKLRKDILSTPSFKIGDVLEMVKTDRTKISAAEFYKYVEIENVGVGEYDYVELRGWELPQRAKLYASTGDIFIPHLWSCAGKWFMAAGDCKNVIVTNGCAQLRVREGKEEYLSDLLIALCSEEFAIQIRGLSTGSDGLAEISDDDLLEIVLPRSVNADLKSQVTKHVQPLITGSARFSKYATTVLESTRSFPAPPRRKSHCALV